MFFRLLLKLNNLHSIKGRYFSTNAVESQLVSGVVDIPLAQTGEGIAECELLKWFVQEEAWEIRGDLNRGCTRLLSANTEQLQLTWFMGAMGDSFYEYLHYRDMWETSMKGLLSLVCNTAPSSFTYISEKIGNSLIDKMDELACFASGMIALGSSGYGPDESTKFLNLAEELTWTCYNFYQSTPTKLAGEHYFFHSGQDMTVGTSWNILSPETVKSRM